VTDMGDGASTRWPTDAKLPKQVPRHVSSLVQRYHLPICLQYLS
jgi:hypothetical protein